MSKPLTRRQQNSADAYYAAFSPKQPVPQFQQAVQAAAVRKASTKPKAASEAAILKAIMMLLKRHPKVARAWRVNSGTFQVDTRWIRANSQRGMSDIAGVLKDGRSLFIEVKAAKGAVMEHQQQFLDDMVRAGALAFVARSVDDVTERLREI